MTIEEMMEVLGKIDVGKFDARLELRFRARQDPQFPDVRVLAVLTTENAVPEDKEKWEGGVMNARWYTEKQKLTPAQLCDLVRTQILDLYQHELDEWLRYDGVLLRDPHPEKIPEWLS